MLRLILPDKEGLLLMLMLRQGEVGVKSKRKG